MLLARFAATFFSLGFVTSVLATPLAPLGAISNPVSSVGSKRDAQAGLPAALQVATQKLNLYKDKLEEEAKKSPNVVTPGYAATMSQVPPGITSVNDAMAVARNNHNLYRLSLDGKTQITAQDLVTRFDDLFKIIPRMMVTANNFESLEPIKPVISGKNGLADQLLRMITEVLNTAPILGPILNGVISLILGLPI
ncbi:hypothetical protein RhiJN_06505 [Ceratobasidium sp. AG-Ba]|nr:hypothetical protein RhiJN_06505 [Ceratobasidium sp. AG-Ba]